MSKNYKFSNKQPKDLTAEELLELTNQIAMVEYSRRNDIKMFQTYEDSAIDVLTYMYEKQARGKKGIDEVKKLPMNHFINTLHFEVRNNINYIVRKKQNRRLLYNTISLEDKYEPGNNNDYRTNGDVISDERQLEETEVNFDLENILSKIDDTENESLIIKYGYNKGKTEQKFSYRNLARLYFNLCDNSKIKSKDLKGILFDGNTGLEIEEDQIKKIMNQFKKYIKESCILGGI
jgi:hypothetical protein